MWWFLVLLGVLVALAGLAVIGLGVVMYLGTLGNTLITTGAVAASGGFVITAMGLVLRQLERLTTKIDQRVQDETIAARARLEQRPAPAALERAPAPAALDYAPSAPPPGIPAPPPRRELPPLLDEADLSEEEDEPAPAALPEPPARRRLPRPPVGRSEDTEAEDEPRPDPMLEARRQRLERRPSDEAPAPAARASAPPPARPRTQFDPPRPAAPAPRAPAPRREAAEPTVLKSGIVGGMAYTLYSDGSIQAELPDGVVRFSSLQELRDHVAMSQKR